MIDFDRVRQDLAMKHNMLMDKDDPAMASAAMFEAALNQCLDELLVQQKAHLDAVSKSIQKGSDEAKATAGKIILDAAGYVSDQAHNAIDATMEEWREELRKDLRLAWNKIERARKLTMFSAAVSSVCALIAVLAMLNVA